jgi:hypothetical protein
LGSNFIFALIQDKPTASTARIAIVGYLNTSAEGQLKAGQFLVFKTAVKRIMATAGLEFPHFRISFCIYIYIGKKNIFLMF